MIKIFKLTTGEELIADVIPDGPSWSLKNPVRLIISEQGVGMIPFAPFVESETVAIDNNHIIYQSNPDSEVLNAYNSKFGGLVIPSNHLKIVQ